jgi:hypothetical protein
MLFPIKPKTVLLAWLGVTAAIMGTGLLPASVGVPLGMALFGILCLGTGALWVGVMVYGARSMSRIRRSR